MKIFIFTLLLLSSALTFTSCESVKSSSEFYRPLTTETFPEKPKNHPIPILGGPPDKPFIIIGRISFQSGHGSKFMMDCIRYNARKNGADAAVMLGENSYSKQYTYTVPGYTTTTPVTTYSTGSSYGNYNYSGSSGYGNISGSSYGSGVSTTYVPQYQPGYTGVGSVTIQSVDAAFIRYK